MLVDPCGSGLGGVSFSSGSSHVLKSMEQTLEMRLCSSGMTQLMERCHEIDANVTLKQGHVSLSALHVWV